MRYRSSPDGTHYDYKKGIQLNFAIDANLDNDNILFIKL